jgi:3-methyladenine DNA glycosylase AlkD
MEARARVDALVGALRQRADPERAAKMAAYMKDQFAFFGVPTTPRRAAQREALGDWRDPSPAELIFFARACWAGAERELQYSACDLLRRHVGRLEGRHLADVEGLIASKSWWDTVDALAAHVVGPLVAVDPELRVELERWLTSGDLWLERAAILHQLGHGSRTDEELLFRMCLTHAASTEFFHRKAIGWALRQHARDAPDAVRAFVVAHGDELSGLSRREATKHLGDLRSEAS